MTQNTDDQALHRSGQRLADFDWPKTDSCRIGRPVNLNVTSSDSGAVKRMSSEVIGFPCVEGDFGTCSAATVRSVLAQHRRDHDTELAASFTLQLVAEDNEYDARIGLEGDQVSSFIIYRPDHSRHLWEFLLDLSDQCRMLLVGSALGEVGCIAANREIVDAMPLDTKEQLGAPIVTRDPVFAVAAICGR